MFLILFDISNRTGLSTESDLIGGISFHAGSSYGLLNTAYVHTKAEAEKLISALREFMPYLKDK